jgi:hypothetical protein
MIIKEQIRIMERYLAGDTILFFDLDDNRTSIKWVEICPNQEEYIFDFENFDYKIKPKELSLEEKVRVEYPDYRVAILQWDKRKLWSIKGYGCYDAAYLHTTAQSMRGFYRYVYDMNDRFIANINTFMHHGDHPNELPVAVLFTKEGK